MDRQDRRREFKQLKPMLDAIAAGIAMQFGANCEVAVHDLTDGLEKTVAIIYNGHVTGRKVGDGATEIVLEALRDKGVSDRYCYLTHTKDGKMLKSSSIIIHGSDNSVLAVICINYDIGDFTLAQRSLSEFLTVKGSADKSDMIPTNVSDLLEQLIEESRELIGKPVSAMSKDDKMRAIRFLDQRGALLIKKSSDRISNYYGISKYTLYNYLGMQE
jgi:predicted transcriptional regulator YheO